MSDTVRVRLLFADRGAFHSEDLQLPSVAFEGYERLIDGLREDPGLLKRLYLDVDRLSAAWVLEEEED
ncbi:hypothetical protein ACFL3S_12210 [Gemmatimonadota bacterium]